MSSRDARVSTEPPGRPSRRRIRAGRGRPPTTTGIGPAEPLTDCDHRPGGLAREVRRDSAAPVQLVEHHARAIGSTIHATPIATSSAATWLGMRMPDAETDQRPEAEDEQAQREGPQIGRRRGTDDVPAAGSAPWRRRRPNPAGQTAPYNAPMPSSDDDLGPHHPDPLGVARKVQVIVLWRYSEPMVMTPMASSQQVGDADARRCRPGRRLGRGRAVIVAAAGRRRRRPR